MFREVSPSISVKFALKLTIARLTRLLNQFSLDTMFWFWVKIFGILIFWIYGTMGYFKLYVILTEDVPCHTLSIIAIKRYRHFWPYTMFWQISDDLIKVRYLKHKALIQNCCKPWELFQLTRECQWLDPGLPLYEEGVPKTGQLIVVGRAQKLKNYKS